MKKACIFEGSNLTIRINPVSSPLVDSFRQPLSPTKISKMLEDAKSIQSRQASHDRGEDFLFDESVLIERDIDMFQFITPVAGVREAEMAKAVDRREGNVVTLKFYRELEEQECHRQLDLLQLMQGLGDTEFPLRILAFRETLIEDKPKKQIILVFGPFERTMSEHLSLLRARGEETELFIGNFIDEVRMLLQLLLMNGVQLVRPLSLEDFVRTENDWRLHNVGKLRLDLQTESSGSEGILRQLREECRQHCNLLNHNN